MFSPKEKLREIIAYLTYKDCTKPQIDSLGFATYTVRMMIRLSRTHQALLKITGGRHARRPCFDFGTPTYHGSDSSNGSRLSDVTCLVGKGLVRLVTPGGTRFFFRDIAANQITRESTIAMALNKLSIDKVELADKRVLIRYVYGF